MKRTSQSRGLLIRAGIVPTTTPFRQRYEETLVQQEQLAAYVRQPGLDPGRLGPAGGGFELHKKREALCLELGNKDGLQRSYGDQAGILQDWGRLEEAMALLKKREALCLEQRS